MAKWGVCITIQKAMPSGSQKFRFKLKKQIQHATALSEFISKS